MEQTGPRGWKMGNEQMDRCMDGRMKVWIWRINIELKTRFANEENLDTNCYLDEGDSV